ncbi:MULTISPECIES: hypothetical protein [unclassified Streptococcus]|nr:MULTISPECIES: hypothetical protein [unclassified Streptococcus]MBF0787448.1 hypothetical protein [Streptococcus sp. 19428wC2_LYSM12]MCQ9212008.1 hypothetical protein [Streptococcus sp. B01]MCQ9213337.1 hypothetical protein [Streptococcus sp. O1]
MTDLKKVEETLIFKYLFGMTTVLKEAGIVTYVDKYWVVTEATFLLQQ